MREEKVTPGTYRDALFFYNCLLFETFSINHEEKMMKRWMSMMFVLLSLAICSLAFAEMPDSGGTPVTAERNEEVPLPCDPALQKPCEPAQGDGEPWFHATKPPDWNPALWQNRLLQADPAVRTPCDPAWTPGEVQVASTICRKEVRVRKLPLPGGIVERIRTLIVHRMML